MHTSMPQLSIPASFSKCSSPHGEQVQDPGISAARTILTSGEQYLLPDTGTAAKEMAVVKENFVVDRKRAPAVVGGARQWTIEQIRTIAVVAVGALVLGMWIGSHDHRAANAVRCVMYTTMIYRTSHGKCIRVSLW